MRVGRAGLALSLMCLAALAGCGRKPPRFVPAGADSLQAMMAADSFAIYVGRALAQWEEQADDAAQATARLLVDDLRRYPDRRLADRARTFIDSCGFSGEVAGGADLAAVNFFYRSDPGGTSWPFLVWREADVVRSQSVEGGGMRLLDLAVRPIREESAASGDGEPRQVAAIFGRAGARGQQPLVLVWRRPAKGTRWSMLQTLGADSLGGVGVVEFVSAPGGGTGLEARTYRPTTGFDECPTCPHINRTLSFAWAPSGFQKTGEEAAP